MKVKIERLDHQGNGIAYIDNKITSSYVTINSKSNNELKINLSNINFNKNN